MKHISLKEALNKKLKDIEFQIYFEESRSISELCNAIVSARQKLGLTQKELADKVNTTQSVIARLENGNQGKTPSLSLLSRIANAFKMHLTIGFEKQNRVA